MGERSDSRTAVERTSDRELTITRSFDAPARLVFQAWTTPALFMRWWAPRSMGMLLRSCEMDVRTGGGYSVTFGDEANSDTFYGKYLEVTPNARLVWTNDESADASVTTVTFTEKDGKTQLVLREVYPSKDAFEANHGAEGALPEQFAQLDELLAELVAGVSGG